MLLSVPLTSGSYTRCSVQNCGNSRATNGTRWDRRIVERETARKNSVVSFSLCSYSVLLCKRERLSPTTSLLICEALRQSSLTNYSSARIQALATTRLRSQRRRRFSRGRSFCQMLCASSLSLVSPKGTRDHFRFCRIGSV